MRHSIKVTAVFIFIFLLSLGSFYLIKSKVPLIQDEYFHFDQIERFINSDYSINTLLMTVPGYHLLISVIARIIQVKSLLEVSVIAWLINLTVIPIFYLTARNIELKSALIKTLEFSFFPLIFPFLQLIYTDILSLTLVLTAIYLMNKKRYQLSGLVITLSMLVRQNNIFFLLLINIWMFVNKNGNRINRKNIVTHISDSKTFIFGGIALLVFYKLNSGFLVSAYARSYLHWTFSNLGNFYFLLFLFFFLFLPINLYNFPKIINLIRENKLIIPGMILAYIFFMKTFVNDHPFNQATWFLRNYLLVVFASSIFMKSLFFLLAFYAALSIAGNRLQEKKWLVIYPFIFLYLLPYWLIEVRYYFIPIALFMLGRKTAPKYIEYAALAIYVVISLFFVNGIANFRFFL